MGFSRRRRRHFRRRATEVSGYLLSIFPLISFFRHILPPSSSDQGKAEGDGNGCCGSGRTVGGAKGREHADCGKLTPMEVKFCALGYLEPSPWTAEAPGAAGTGGKDRSAHPRRHHHRPLTNERGAIVIPSYPRRRQCRPALVDYDQRQVFVRAKNDGAGARERGAKRSRILPTRE